MNYQIIIILIFNLLKIFLDKSNYILFNHLINITGK